MPSKPKSFIDIQRKVKSTPQQPIIHTPSASLSPDQLALENTARKANIKLLNNVRCPICLAQLDGGVFSNRAALECVADPSHYECSYFSPRPDGLTFAEAISQGKPNVQTLHLRSDVVDGYQVMCPVQESGLYSCVVYKLDTSLSEPHRSRYKEYVATFTAEVERSWCASYEVFAKKVELLQLLS
jgi:hypothetical protein